MDTSDSTSSPLHAQDLICRVLNWPPPRLTEGLTLGDIPGWDSLAMVRLVLAIEERIGRQLNDLELESIETVADVEKVMNARRPL
jgi:acyl carrier protein